MTGPAVAPIAAVAGAVPRLLADQGGDSGGAGLLLGDDFFPWMVLALGAALVVGNVLALVRPPVTPAEPGTGRSGEDGATREARRAAEGDRPRPPLARTAVLISLGLLASLWGLASLLS